MKSANPNLTPQVIDQMLAAGELTDDIGSTGPDNQYGYGLVNARKAVESAINRGAGPGVPSNPTLGVTPGSLNFNGNTNAIEISVQNTNTGDLRITGITTDQGWINVSAANVDGDGLGNYLVTVNRAALSDGIYSGQITVRSTRNNVTVDIVVSVTTNSRAGDIGHVYALLVDIDTNEVVQQLNPVPENGVYPFTFEEVPIGRYNIFAGTDSDNDFFLCDGGEACGAYVTIEKPAVIEVVTDTDNLDFPLGYSIALPARGASADNAANKSANKAPRGVLRLLQTPPGGGIAR